jgi:hypothetical protein
MTLPTAEQCHPFTDVRDAPWLWSYVGAYQSSPPRIRSARTAPPPTLAPQFHSLRSRRLLAAWLTKHGPRAVYSMAVEERWRPAVRWRK